MFQTSKVASFSVCVERAVSEFMTPTAMCYDALVPETCHNRLVCKTDRKLPIKKLAEFASVHFPFLFSELLSCAHVDATGRRFLNGTHRSAYLRIMDGSCSYQISSKLD
jgi:hypothetical protein